MPNNIFIRSLQFIKYQTMTQKILIIGPLILREHKFDYINFIVETSMDRNQPQPEYIDDWNNPESEETKRESSKKQFFKNFCYVDQCNFTATNLSQDNRVEVTLKPYDQRRKYLTVYPGLNIKGTCQNKDCLGYHKNVWVKKGYGEKINFGQTRFGNKCPSCNQGMSSKSFKTLGFRNAKVKFQGARVVNDEEQKFYKEDQEKNGKFITFRDYDEATCEWIYLNITVQKK